MTDPAAEIDAASERPPPHGVWIAVRPVEEAGRTRTAFAARGALAVTVPVATIRPVAPEPFDPARVQGVLLTSRNGARALGRFEIAHDRPVLAVGDATADKARAAGFREVYSAGGAASDLVGHAANLFQPDCGALLHLRGADILDDPGPALAAQGFEIWSRIVYRAEAIEALPEEAVRAIADPAIRGVAIFSPRGAEVFDRVLAHAGLAERRSRLVALCLSAAVAERLSPTDWAEIRVAARPTLAALLDLVAPKEAHDDDRDGSDRAMSTDDRKPAPPDGAAGQVPEANPSGSSPAASPPSAGVPPQDPAPAGGDPSGDAPASGTAPPEAPPATPTERIIDQFGGIRPMAAKLAIPVTTVQGWKRRNAIPEQRHADILDAARQFGIALDPGELAKTTPANPGPAPEDDPLAAPEAEPPRTEPGLPVTRDPPPAPRPPPPPAPSTGRWTPAVIAIVAAAAAVTAPLWAPGLYGLDRPQDSPSVISLNDRVAFLEGRVAETPTIAPAALEELTDRIAAAESTLGALGPPDEPAATDAALRQIESGLAGRIDDLAGRLDALAARLDAADGGDAAVTAQDLAALTDRLAALDEAATETRGALEAVQGAVDDLADRQAEAARLATDLETRLAAIEARPGRDDLANGVALALSVGQLRDALATGGDVAPALETVEGAFGDDPAAAEALASLRRAAEQGVPTLATLTAGFPAAADAARRADRVPADGDWVDRSLAALEGIVTVRPAPGEVAGDDLAAILARAEGRLRAGDLAGADAALAAVDGPAADAVAGWRGAAALRLEAESAIARLQAMLTERSGAAPAP